jgi:hydroxymethylbilane synthase
MILGTRGSRLAMTQADMAVAALRVLLPDEEVEVKVVPTTGDLVRDRPLSQLGGYGAFVKELDAKIVSGEIDASVNSLKDMPVEPSRGVELCALLPRGPAEDVLVGFNSLSEIPVGTKVGTSSVRRRALLLHYRPDLRAVDLRGNVTTRLGKLKRGEYDAIILARAGLERLGETPQGCILNAADFVPAPGQGAVALCTLKGSPTASKLKLLDDAKTRHCIEAERLVLLRLGGGCSVPIGVHARLKDGDMLIDAIVLKEDGSAAFRRRASFGAADSGALEDFAAIMVKGAGSL